MKLYIFKILISIGKSCSAFVSSSGSNRAKAAAVSIKSNLHVASIDHSHFAERLHASKIWMAQGSSFHLPSLFLSLDEPMAAGTTTTGAVNAATSTFALSPTQTILVFIIGVIPFAIATYEFWRRIAFGESFGTGSDSIVIIGEEDAPESSRGQRVLGKGALVVAYALFAIAAAVLGLVIYSVTTSATLPETALL
ncbi:hypothetical protein MPSEU_000755800 [Mayamaea pseudoterrestris]|nr:hypothetical protein MPSEU_000755800 [Mayamaea pseudoterrestris]